MDSVIVSRPETENRTVRLSNEALLENTRIELGIVNERWAEISQINSLLVRKLENVTEEKDAALARTTNLESRLTTVEEELNARILNYLQEVEDEVYSSSSVKRKRFDQRCRDTTAIFKDSQGIYTYLL